MNATNITDASSPAAILQELIRIPSVSSMSNRPVIAYVRGVLEPTGWQFVELPYLDASGVEKVNLIAVPPGQSPAELSVDLAFVCHTDTVPFSPAWKEALDAEIHHGMVHGCGACDVKGFLACLLCALAGTPEIKFAHSIALVLTAEEEVGCLGAKRLMEERRFHARHAIIGEPTSLHPARAGKGYGLAEIRVYGQEAHSAHPAMGASAIYRAARLIGKIEEYSRSLQSAASGAADLFDPPYTTLNVGTITGGSAKNIVPGECTFLLEWRPLPGDGRSDPTRAVQQMVEELRQNDSSFQYEIRVLRQQSGFETQAQSPLVERWSQLTGKCAITIPFSTEAPLMSALSDEVMVTGPGDMQTAHSSRECVALTELEECVRCLQQLLHHPLENSG